MPRSRQDHRDFSLDFSPMRRFRRANEISQSRLAEAVGVHWTTISRIERGRTQPPLRLLVAIARVFGKPMHHLFNVVEADGQ